MTDERTYGARVERERLEQDPPWTQRELARHAGVHFNTVYRVEAEVTWPSLVVQQKLANALGCERHDLFR